MRCCCFTLWVCDGTSFPLLIFDVNDEINAIHSVLVKMIGELNSWILSLFNAMIKSALFSTGDCVLSSLNFVCIVELKVFITVPPTTSNAKAVSISFVLHVLLWYLLWVQCLEEKWSSVEEGDTSCLLYQNLDTSISFLFFLVAYAIAKPNLIINTDLLINI